MAYLLKDADDVKNIFSGIKTPIFYVTNNADKGVGLEKIIPNYHIICIDYDDEADYLEEKGVKVFCLEKALGKKNIIFRNSALLLAQPQAVDYIKKNSSSEFPPAIILFKPSVAAEKIASANRWRILNNRADLSRELEDKLNFSFIAKSLRIKIPDVEIMDLGRISYWELKKYYDHFVIQLKNGFAGNSTYFIRNESDYANLIKMYLSESAKDKSLPVKVSKFIKGIPATVNVCVLAGEIYAGKPCYQITGEEACTNIKSATCGNDWSALSLSLGASNKISEIAETAGQYLKKKKYKGIFGLDLIIGENGEIYLIEINSRLVASVPFYTKLEIRNSAIPMLALHILEFLGADYDCRFAGGGRKRTANIGGAQIVIRNKERKNCVVSGQMRSGVYIMEKGNPKYLRTGFSIDDLARSEEFIILTAAKGRLVKPEAELARVEFLKSVVSRDYRLNKDIFLLAGEIYKRLKLEPV